MTHEEIRAYVMQYLKNHYRKVSKFLGDERLLREAGAIAELARMEMDAIKAIAPSMSDHEAWTEARALFLVRPDWAYDEMERANDEEEDE